VRPCLVVIFVMMTGVRFKQYTGKIWLMPI
jgi:hypothetical protein